MDDNGESRLEFGCTEETERQEHLLPNFYEQVLRMDYADVLFVSDGTTSLWDFTSPVPAEVGDEFVSYLSRIEERYRVDASDIEDGNLVRVLEGISAPG